MAQIVISEVSANYTYNVGNNSYATVAMPITSCWGPGFFDTDATVDSIDAALEEVKWLHFPATQSGVESFVSTFRGPSSGYRAYGDHSYQMAMTLLAAGYDVTVCRLSAGNRAIGAFTSNTGDDTATSTIHVTAKYPGTFGNKLQVYLKKTDYRVTNPDGTIETKYCWNMIVYVVDVSGIKTAVENLTFVFDLNNASDTMLHWTEIESEFVTLEVEGTIDDSAERQVIGTGVGDVPNIRLADGTDYKAWDSMSADAPIVGIAQVDVAVLQDTPTPEDIRAAAVTDAIGYATSRYSGVGYDPTACDYITQLTAALDSTATNPMSLAEVVRVANWEWMYTAAVGFAAAGSASGIKGVYDLLKDKLTYNPNRIISPGWDDQDFSIFNAVPTGGRISIVSPMHAKLMDVAYYSRCATSIIDIPRQCLRRDVYNDSTDNPGYAQLLARFAPSMSAMDVNGTLYQTHSALFAPWGKYMYAGTGKQAPASPSFLALMIQRAQILNQPMQYEWALPTNRKHNLPIGKMDYAVTKHLLDEWQSLEGVGVNVITNIPDLGTNIWGNSTLIEVPPATYQALANLSTRYLVNAVENVAYRCGLNITFSYNNGQAYNKFFAGCTPILDTMRNVGAIEDYRIEMGADVNSLDQVNANTVIGKIYLVINGVINDIYIDLICLPQGTNLDDYIQ